MIKTETLLAAQAIVDQYRNSPHEPSKAEMIACLVAVLADSAWNLTPICQNTGTSLSPTSPNWENSPEASLAETSDSERQLNPLHMPANRVQWSNTIPGETEHCPICGKASLLNLPCYTCAR